MTVVEMMEHLPDFIANHTLLVLAFVTVAGMLLWSFFGANLQGYAQVGPVQAVQLINHEDAVIVDVRESGEYTQGHILDSVHIPLAGLNGQLGKLEKYRERPVILACQSGNRSGHACRILKQNGFDKVYNLRHGMTAWYNASLPVTKGKK